MQGISRKLPVRGFGKTSSESSRWGAIGFVAGLFLLLCGCASPGVKGPFALLPGEGKEASFEREGLVVASRHLAGTEGADFLRSRGLKALSADLGKLPLTFFRLRIVNRSREEAIIDPAGTRLVTDSGPALSALTFVHLYQDISPGPPREELLGGFREISFDRPESVVPGGELDRVLLFRSPEKVGEGAVLVFRSLYLGGKEVEEGQLPFRAVPLGQ